MNGYLRSAGETGVPAVYVICGEKVNPGVDRLLKEHKDFFVPASEKELEALFREGAIADICTPTSTHRSVFEKMMEKGAERFLIEKPMACSAGDIAYIAGSDAVFGVMNNYLFSKATKRVLELIADGFSPVSMYSNFSKDRTRDSICGRGFSDGVAPHVFTLEIPHQLYLASAFLGKGRILSASAEDMKAGGMVLSGHGSGRIRMEHGSAVSVHDSCLCSDKITRMVRLTDAQGNQLTVSYYLEDRPLTSSILLAGTEGSLRREFFDKDDMMTEAVSFFYANLSSGTMAGREKAVYDASLIIDALQEKSHE